MLQTSKNKTITADADKNANCPVIFRKCWVKIPFRNILSEEGSDGGSHIPPLAGGDHSRPLVQLRPLSPPWVASSSLDHFSCGGFNEFTECIAWEKVGPCVRAQGEGGEFTVSWSRVRALEKPRAEFLATQDRGERPASQTGVSALDRFTWAIVVTNINSVNALRA